MKRKAQFVGRTHFREGNRTYTSMEYSYKGRTYFVEDHGWHSASDEALWMQHKREQDRIDKLIELKDKEPVELVDTNNDPVTDCLDKLFDYWNGNEQAFD